MPTEVKRCLHCELFAALVNWANTHHKGICRMDDVAKDLGALMGEVVAQHVDADNLERAMIDCSMLFQTAMHTVVERRRSMATDPLTSTSTH